jgi:DNA-binding MarR family transcriptional regulator
MFVSVKLFPIVVIAVLTVLLGILLRATLKQGEKADRLLFLIYKSEREGLTWSDRDNYSHLLESLEEQGYIASEEDPTDDDTTEIPHRIYTLTKLGRERAEELLSLAGT